MNPEGLRDNQLYVDIPKTLTHWNNVTIPKICFLTNSYIVPLTLTCCIMYPYQSLLSIPTVCHFLLSRVRMYPYCNNVSIHEICCLTNSYIVSLFIHTVWQVMCPHPMSYQLFHSGMNSNKVLLQKVCYKSLKCAGLHDNTYIWMLPGIHTKCFITIYTLCHSNFLQNPTIKSYQKCNVTRPLFASVDHFTQFSSRWSI